MFTFGVVQKQSGRTGSVVSHAVIEGGVGYAIIMWDDDFSFEVLDVEDFTAQPIQGLEDAKKFAVLNFPKDDDDTTH